MAWNGQYFDVNKVQINVLQEFIEVDPIDGVRHCVPGLRYTEFFLDGEMVFEQDFARVYPLLHNLTTPRESRKATMTTQEMVELMELCRRHEFPETHIGVMATSDWSVPYESAGGWEEAIHLCRTSRKEGWEAYFKTKNLPYEWLSIPLSTKLTVTVPTKAVCRWCHGTGTVQGLQETYPCLECQTK